MTIGTAKLAMIAAMSCPGVLIGAPCGASLMLVSSPWVCERYSVTATSCSIIQPRTIIDARFRRRRGAAEGVQQAFTRIGGGGRRLGAGAGWGHLRPSGGRVGRKPGILSVSLWRRSVLVAALSC